MGSKIIADALQFSKMLRTLQEECEDSSIYEEDIQILRVNGEKQLHYIYSGDKPVFICERTAPQVDPEDEKMDETHSDDETNHEAKIELGPQPLTIMKARQLLSWYTMSQNTNVSPAVSSAPLLPPALSPAPLLPLWVRCDMADPAGTTWLGAETVCTGNKVSGVKLYSVTCTGSTVDKGTFITVDELKQEHKKRHHPSLMVARGTAQYNLFGSTVVENTTIESQSSVTVDFRWSHVESILETPPLSSMATLNIKVSSGDMRSPMYPMYRELEFLQILADGLRTGETEWMEPLETRSAVQLTREYLDELQNSVKTLQDQSTKETVKGKTETGTSEMSIFNSLMERGDLDFIEQLWVRMRNSVTSYQDIGDCLKLVIKALQYGDIKPWIHRDSGSSLSRLILQSYHHQMDYVSLTGLTPVHMLLEMGLDKMRKDYINYLIGQELTTLNHLSYYLSTEEDLQEQVIRVRKLHHLLEILGTCSTFLGLPYDRLFLLTQLCLQYYKTCPYDEDHEFKLQIKPALISHFYQREQAVSWGVEVSSGNGPREVKTSWQLSEKPLVEHIVFETDFHNEMTVNGDGEEAAYFTTMVCCSLVNFAA
ncbi:protein zwilch homolog isoform X1 [Coregonus clupeaformis]|uniref:protein zwilch homolog isoform X1 n=1 Tax=Coregonus clupeaformis TaxID=59861 RepID=UPI001BDF9034|nr:protein zwilch homolog isoform X1 [Coregonus clupeaformis]